MSRLDFALADEVVARFPEATVGAFVASGLDVARISAPDAADLVRTRRDALLSGGLTVDDLMRDQRIVSWRQAIRACGLSASSFRSSAEQLARRFLKDDAFATPLPIVTAYCAISAHRLAPLAAYDVDRLPRREIALRTWREGDRYEPLGGAPSDLPTTPDVVVYACGSEVVCYAWNVRDSQRTCLLPDTRRAVFVGESATAFQRDACRVALTELASWLSDRGARVGPVRFAGADGQRFTLETYDPR